MHYDDPDPATLTDARERDKAHNELRRLTTQVQLLREGRLLCAPGVAYERLDSLDARIVELRARRDRAQRALDEHLRQADQLLAAAPVTN